MLYTDLPDEIDRSAIGLIYDAWRNKSVDKRAAAICALNLLGYAANQAIPATFGAAGEPSDEDIDAAFQALMQEPAPNTVYGAGLDIATLLKTIIPIVIKILSLLL